MRKILSRAFFLRPTKTVARDLLGKYLVRRDAEGHEHTLMITEVEAYDGPHDRASHAFRGRTPRTSVMFGNPGIWYVYFTYGMHWMVNIVTGPKEYPAAVLLRGGVTEDPDTGMMVQINGPARLTKFLSITRNENNLPARRTCGLWIEDHGNTISTKHIIASKRVGVEYAGAIWANKPYNFRLTSFDKKKKK